MQQQPNGDHSLSSASADHSDQALLAAVVPLRRPGLDLQCTGCHAWVETLSDSGQCARCEDRERVTDETERFVATEMLGRAIDGALTHGLTRDDIHELVDVWNGPAFETSREG